ncbi:MAG TPA: hypothetical protein VGD78_03485, partial [Chthoniobacterales bacterium]
GLSVGILSLVVFFIGCRARWKGKVTSVHAPALPSFLLAGVAALLYYCASLGSWESARLLAPYYPVLLLLVLWWSGSSPSFRAWWWRGLAGILMVLPMGLITIYPGHPIIGITVVVDRLPILKNTDLKSKVNASYYRHAMRADGLRKVRDLLPDGVNEIGLLGYDGATKVSLWRPFGERQVLEALNPTDRVHLPEWLVVCESGLVGQMPTSVDTWAHEVGATRISSTNVLLDERDGPLNWSVYRRRNDAASR